MERNVRRQYGRPPLDFKYWNIKFQNAGGVEDLQRPGELVQRKWLRLWDNILNKALANEFLSKLRWFSKVKYKLMYTRKIKTVHALEPADFSWRTLFYFVKFYRPKLIGKNLRRFQKVFWSETVMILFSENTPELFWQPFRLILFTMHCRRYGEPPTIP